MKYKNLFFDLDDTIWAFSQNARNTFEEVYQKYSFDRYFDSFNHYYTLYQQRNTELWVEKMRSAGVDGYFRKVILSEDLGVLKPWPEIFNFALSATQSELRESLMIGDSWEADITGAHGVGMHQVFYNVTERTAFPFLPTYHIHSLKELMDLL